MSCGPTHVLYVHPKGIEKGIRIKYPYNFGFPFSNSDFVTIWLKFYLWSVQLYKAEGLGDNAGINSTSTFVEYYHQTIFSIIIATI